MSDPLPRPGEDRDDERDRFDIDAGVAYLLACAAIFVVVLTIFAL